MHDRTGDIEALAELELGSRTSRAARTIRIAAAAALILVARRAARLDPIEALRRE